MAYVGLTHPVIAVYEERNGVVSYKNGTRFGKAVKYEISPNYEDVSDYQDINGSGRRNKKRGHNTRNKRNVRRFRGGYIRV